jgi:hypothetical protein
MSGPDQSLLEADLAAAEFRCGAAKGLWGFEIRSSAWPAMCFWLAAAARGDAPARYYVQLDMTGYRSVAPTGRFWNPESGMELPLNQYPKGKPGSRFAMVFRTDSWRESNKAFYHPYDRIAAQGHPDWPRAMPHLIWTSKHTIVDYLEEFQSLLMSGDYVGV